VKQKRMKEIESLREEIERQLMSMESYKKYVDEVRQKGTACDVARAARDLHVRADELMTFDVTERTLADLGHANVIRLRHQRRQQNTRAPTPGSCQKT